MAVDPRLDLNMVIRPTIARLEDTVILHLFQRARYKINEIVYMPGGIKIPGFNGSFLDYMMFGRESLQATVGKFEHSRARPFSENLPLAIITRKEEESPVRKENININQQIKEMYIEEVKKICEDGDDNHYGSSAEHDVNCLQALSRRIHFGDYVAESKFQEDPECYTKLIKLKDVEGIIKKLKNLQVEEIILGRVKEKGKRYNVNPEFIEAFYRDKIIPLTIKVEVEYFFRRV